MTTTTASAAEPKLMVLLARADHFFPWQLKPVQQALAGWLTSCIKEQLQ
jgi:hypothetical protein